MADFVAVIRRTVDGLSDNVPEMRAKVYDKARSAVRRQLESMKPRPSDDMIDRQMVKLEAAIGEVESDHAEALPPVDDQQFDTAVEPVDIEDHVPASAEPVDAAVKNETPDAQALEEGARDRELPTEETPPAPLEPVEAYQDHAAAVAPVEVTETAVEEDADLRFEAAEVHTAPVPEEDRPFEAAPVEAEHVRSTEPEEYHPQAVEQPKVEYGDEQEHERTAEPLDHPDDTLIEARPVYAHPVEAEPVEAAPVAGHDETPAGDNPASAQSSEWELPEWNDPAPATAHSEPVWAETADQAAIVDEIPDLTDYEPVETVTPMRDSADGRGNAAGEPSHSWAWDDSDPFTQMTPAAQPETSEPAISDWSWPVEKTAAAAPEPTASRGGWDDADDLLEHGAVPAAGAAAGLRTGKTDSTAYAADDDMAPSRPVSYRVEPKRSSFNGKRIALVVLVLLALGGAGYGYWQNQTAVNSWVSGMVASVTAQIEAQVPGQTTPDEPASNGGTGDLPVPEGNTQTPTRTQPDTDVAALDTSSKFTQRLQPDGTEVDQGPAPAPAGEKAAEEGKSVAAQTEAGKPQDSAAQASAITPAGQTKSETQPAQPVPGQQAASDPATSQVPAGAQKMFLYEERLGQSAPTAIEGNVAWSVKEESPGGDAKPEPVVQAQINVPERGLTALMTIKRNADPSLPASHVIEFVFSLPENFEGGSIDSVQRVAMKRNEQDRGDALIAVPAKITEDFHMIALNDFPEAVTTNTELLRSRSWIDIPLTYRNGRRALLTLEKGEAGTAAFAKAMQAWSVVASPNPALQ